MKAKLGIEIKELPDGDHRAMVEIGASDSGLRVAYVTLSKAVAEQLGMTVLELAMALVLAVPLADKHISTEAVVDMGAIRRAQQRGGGANAADR